MSKIKTIGRNGPVTTLERNVARKIIQNLPIVESPEKVEREFQGHTYWDNPEISEHLDGLDLSPTESLEAVRHLSWDTWDNRCQVLADTLRVNAGELGRYLWDLAHKAPDLNSNGWDYRQELASHITTTLLQEKHRTAGNWGLVRISASCAYRHWYRDYSRGITRNKIIQAVSLERERWGESGSIDFGATLVEMDSESKLDILATFRSLPDAIRDTLERKISKVPLLASERKRLSRWMQNSKRIASNGEILKARLAGKPGAYALEFGKAART